MSQSKPIDEASLEDIFSSAMEVFDEHLHEVRTDTLAPVRIQGLLDGTNREDDHMFNILDDVIHAAGVRMINRIRVQVSVWNDTLPEIVESNTDSIEFELMAWSGIRDPERLGQLSKADQLLLEAMYLLWLQNERS